MTSIRRKPRPRYHHGDLRNALIAEALRILETESPDTLSLRALGRRLGVSQAAPYRHFPDKESLLAAVAGEGFRGLHDAIVARRDAAGPGHLDRLEAGCLAYIEYGVSHPSHYSLMFAGLFKPEDHPEVRALGAEAFQLLIDGIAECQEAGVFKACDPVQAAMAMWSAIHGAVDLMLKGHAGPDATRGPGDAPKSAPDLGRLVFRAMAAGMLA